MEYNTKEYNLAFNRLSNEISGEISKLNKRFSWSYPLRYFIDTKKGKEILDLMMYVTEFINKTHDLNGYKIVNLSLQCFEGFSVKKTLETSIDKDIKYIVVRKYIDYEIFDNANNEEKLDIILSILKEQIDALSKKTKKDFSEYYDYIIKLTEENKERFLSGNYDYVPSTPIYRRYFIDDEVKKILSKNKPSDSLIPNNIETQEIPQKNKVIKSLKELLTFEKPIKEDDFWYIINLMDWDKQIEEERVKPAVDYLSRKSDKYIFGFHEIMSKLLYDLDTRKLARKINRSDDVDSDTFLYQRCVALINGKNYYYAVLNGKEKINPKNWYEAVLYIPVDAYSIKHNISPNDYPYLPKYSYESFSNKEGWE